MQNLRFKIKNSLVIFLGLITILGGTSLGMDLSRWKRGKATRSEFLEAIDFTLPDLSANKVSLSEFRDKKIILLTFWATWCPYCRREVAILKKIYARYSKGVEILAIDIRESREHVNRFKEKENINYRILLDSEAIVASIYKVVGVPTNIIIDKEGKVRYYGFGWPDNLEEIIKELLVLNPR